MKHNWLFVTIASLLLFTFGQANAVDMSARISPEWAPDTVLVGEPFSIDIYGYNDDGELMGASMPFSFYSPDVSISNVTHTNVSGFPSFDWWAQEYLTDSSILEHNGWGDPWVIWHEYYGFSWDGSLPDTANGTFAGMMAGWLPNTAPTKYISFHFQVDETGTFCIDSCSVPGTTPPGMMDWLFDIDVPFNGPYCFTVHDTTFVPNSPPVLEPIGDKNIDEDALLSFPVTATDPDGDVIKLFTSTRPDGANFTDQGDGTGTFSWTPTYEQAGDYPVIFFATDGIDTVSEAITITVNDVNRAPVLASIGNKSVDENVELTFPVTATDPDGDAIELLHSVLPDGAGFTDQGDGTGTFTWTPTYEQASDYPVTFYATDGVDTVSEAITITVNNVNRVPVLASIGNKSVDENVELTFPVTATDPDGDAIELLHSDLPDGASFTDQGDGTGSFSWTPTYAQAADYPVTFYATDGVDTVSEAITITVNDVPLNACLEVIPDSLLYTANLCGDVGVPPYDSQFVFVSNCGEADLNWTVSVDEGWAAFSPGSGTNDDSVAVWIDWLDFIDTVTIPPVGDTTFMEVTLTVESPGADNSPQFVTVRVALYCEPGEYELIVLPATFDFTLTKGDSLAEKFYVSEKYNQIINFWYANSSDWLTPPTPSDSLTTPDSVEFMVRTADLDVGTYNDDIVITTMAAPSNSPQVIPVTLKVEAPVVTLAADPTSFEFSLEMGDSLVGVDSLTISTLEGYSVSFWTYNSSGWLYLDTIPASPLHTPKTFALDVRTEGLIPGAYYDTIEVHAVEAVNAPLLIPVSLSVTGGYAIETIPTSFTFTITEGEMVYDTLFVREIYDRSVPFAATNYYAWLNVPGGEFPEPPFVTPVNIPILVTDDGLTPGGPYYDSILINSASDTISFDEVVVVVELTVNEFIPVVRTTPESFSFTLEQGESLTDQVLYVYEESGASLVFGADEVVGDGWLYVKPDDTLSTVYYMPDTVYFDINAGGLAPGTYEDTIVIYSPPFDSEFDPLYVPVELVVQEAAVWASLQASSDSTPATVEVTVDAAELEPGQYQDLFYVINTTPAPKDPMQCEPLVLTDSIFYFTAMAGYPGFDTLFFEITTTDTQCVATFAIYHSSVINPDTIPAERLHRIEVFLTVEAGEDMVWISTLPGPPGTDVVLPVYFKNAKTLMAINVPLTWTSDAIQLNEVSFDDTRVSFVDNKWAVIDNASRQVQIGIVPTFTDYILPGSGMLAKLHFSVSEFAAPEFVEVHDTVIFPDGGLAFLDEMLNIIHPTLVEGGIVIGPDTGFFCGNVYDTSGNEIMGAVVELWPDFPTAFPPIMTDTTDINGQFKCHTVGISPFDVYAYKEGYYPALVENVQLDEMGINIYLTPVSEVVKSNLWADFICIGENYYEGVPLPVGSVIDVYDPDGVHCGSRFVSEAGSYIYMPVYGDQGDTPEDEGAEQGDTLTFLINTYPANTSAVPIWTFDGDLIELCLDVFSIEERTIPLNSGWNLISWNVDTPDDEIGQLLSSVSGCVTVVHGFEQGGLTYDPVLPEFSTLQSVDHLHGCWIYMDCPDTLIVEGVPVAATTPIAVEKGWNLVSYLPDSADTVPHALSSVEDDGNLIVAFGFEAGGLIYEPGSIYSNMYYLKPGFGYWLKIMHDDALIYPSGSEIPMVSFRQAFARADKVEAVSKIRTSRLWMNIYSYGLTLDNNPVPIGTEIEVVSLDGSIVGAGVVRDDGLFGFVPVYGDDAATAEKEGLRAGEEFTLVVDGVETAETFVWTRTGDRLEISSLTARTGAVLPMDFSLAQNYPNPFNPTTTILFSVPYTIETRVEIYNILGEKVKTVFDGIASPGTNNVVWNGDNESGEPVATGIYFYRMIAGNFEQSRKMVLMK